MEAVLLKLGRVGGRLTDKVPLISINLQEFKFIGHFMYIILTFKQNFAVLL